MDGTENVLAPADLGEAPALSVAAAPVPDQMDPAGTGDLAAGMHATGLGAPCKCGSGQYGEADLESSLSHTVRTQLTVITLLSTNLDLLYDRLEDEKRRQMIRDLREQTRLLNGLVISALEVLQRPE